MHKVYTLDDISVLYPLDVWEQHLLNKKEWGGMTEGGYGYGGGGGYSGGKGTYAGAGLGGGSKVAVSYNNVTVTDIVLNNTTLANSGDGKVTITKVK